MNQLLDWWSSLNHGGLLIAPRKIQEVFGSPLPPLSVSAADRLRRELTRFDGTDDALAGLLDYVLEVLCGLPEQEWQKGPRVDGRWSFRSFTKEVVKPRRLWLGPKGEVLPVFVPEGGASRHAGARLGVGRSRKLLGRIVEWLRRLNQPLALVTNGRQWRLVHAGTDYDAWCEWDIDLWFQEGQPSEQVLAWRELLARESLLSPKAGEPGPLLGAVLDSRKGQAELSAVLGERVRQAVEELITASHGAIESALQQGAEIDFRDLYRAGTRIMMRCIITFFAEARGLLPVDNQIYQHSYSLEGLRQQLDRRSGGRGGERLSQGRSAWQRIMALFSLIQQGSAHEALPVPQYGGALFEPGRADGLTGIQRALALLESPSNAISDKQVHYILRLLTRTKVKVRQGRHAMWVDGPVDFSTLSSEYIGILYEGLLDFELKQAEGDDPIIFLGVGREPALPLSRLETMDEKAIKQLFDKLKKKDKGPSADEGDNEDVEGDDDEGPGDDEAVEDDAEGNDDEDPDPEVVDNEADAIDDLVETEAEETDHLRKAQAWLERAAEVAGLVRRPRGRTAASDAEFAAARARAGRLLCARLVEPGEFYLVRWGGTRKGAGTFYTRPQLVAPTVRRTLQPLAFEPITSQVNEKTGLTEVTEWRPRCPEEILALKVCDPAMGSGSFLVGALRFLTDVLVQSLYFHGRIQQHLDGGVARLADGNAAEGLGDELLPFPPDHEAFEDALRARLKRHVVERCIYGVDIDPLAVELGRMALWVETMDRSLPFGFLDHKLKVGNALVGAWFDSFQEYPAMAWEREGGDGSHDRFVHHFHTVTPTRGRNAGRVEKQSDVWTAAIKARRPEVQQELIDELNGQLRLGDAGLAIGVHAELIAVFDRLHRLPVHDTESRARLFEEQVLASPHYKALKARLDLWCALWFWPGAAVDQAPLPSQFAAPSPQALAKATQMAEAQHFFHWELEFPDVFTPQRSGFDAVLGNPPWEIQKPNSKEFFSNIDPLYRAYGKQEALAQQVEYFANQADDEEVWLRYNADLKARSNWVKYVGIAFGDTVREDKDGKRKHDLNIGGHGKKAFAESSRLHGKWRKRREGRPCFSDRAHPFLHQGSADLNTYKMFLEQSHALLKPGGRVGMIAPSGVYTDHGSTALRGLLLDHCDWQWLFGFENREGIFDIHRSYKFCLVIAQKGGQTPEIRTAFMRGNVDDWDRADEHVMVYPRERVAEFSPNSKTILEIRSRQDLEVLQKIYANGVLLGDSSERGWSVKYATEFHMTNDSKLFPERPKWEARGFKKQGPIAWFNGEEIALPVYNAKMFDHWDFCSAKWIRGKGRGAVWQPIPFPKEFGPEYLMAKSDYLNAVGQRARVKVVFKDISTAIHKRTMMPALIPNLPAVNASPVLTCDSVLGVDLLQTVLASYIFDYVAKFKIGYLHLNYFIIAECPLVRREAAGSMANDIRRYAMALGCPHESFAPHWITNRSLFDGKSWRQAWAVTLHERVRVQCILDALMAFAFDLSLDDLKWVLADIDFPAKFLARKANRRTLDPKRFWRVDKELDPELRRTVLTIAAFADLSYRGLDCFLSQNAGEGWRVPERLRLADLGLGRDQRANSYQEVALRLGPRYSDWQISEDIEDSWEECDTLANTIESIVPPSCLEAPGPSESDNNTESSDLERYQHKLALQIKEG